MINAELGNADFISDFDGLKISAVVSIPNETIRGIVQIVHGMNEHKERYFDFMDYLAGKGFICAIHDNRGHGGSIKNPEDLGFMYRNGGEGFVEDIAQFNRIVRNMCIPALPCFLIGHSMGSLGARCFLKKYDTYIDGIIVSGSPSYNRYSGIVSRFEASVLAGYSERYRCHKIAKISEKVFNRGLGDIPHSWICTQKDVVYKFNADPLCSFTYTLNGYRAVLYLIHETYNKNGGWEVKNPQLPIRFVSGADDTVMVSERDFKKSVHFLRERGYRNISYKLFDGMRHEILNEKNNQAVYMEIEKTLYSWIAEIDKKQKG